MKPNLKIIILTLVTITIGCFATPLSAGSSDRAGESPKTHLSRVFTNLENTIAGYVEDKDARIGVAVIANHHDTVCINGNREFPMMSVFKFPLSLAVAQWVDSRGGSFDDSVSITSAMLRDNTYSPMFQKYGKTDIILPISELVDWSLVHSDNNACDILLDLIGGTAVADSLLRQLGVNGEITIGATEAEMDADHYLIYLNRATPLAMAALFERFQRAMCHQSSSFKAIESMLERCQTGMDRLPAPLASNAIIGHKTGTGFTTPDGRLTALNDCGYVRLPDGTTYTIAVFVADSAYDGADTAKIIADISRLVLSAIQNNLVSNP